MSLAWRICLQGNLRGSAEALTAWRIGLQGNPRDAAEALARSAGESAYFNSVMLPVIVDSVSHGHSSQQTSPRGLTDFLRIFIPTLPDE